MMLVSAMVPPPSINTSSQEQESNAYSINGQSNSARPYQPVAKLYGRHRIFPALGSTPHIQNIGSMSTIQTLYDFGLGNVELSDMRIGDTPVSSYDMHHGST